MQVLEARDAFWHAIGAMRAAADESFAKSITVPYNNALKSGLVVKATVTKVTKTGVHVEGRDEPIPFDYLVLATGAKYSVEAFRPSSNTLDDMLADINATRAKVEAVRVLGV